MKTIRDLLLLVCIGGVDFTTDAPNWYDTCLDVRWDRVSLPVGFHISL